MMRGNKIMRRSLTRRGPGSILMSETLSSSERKNGTVNTPRRFEVTVSSSASATLPFPAVTSATPEFMVVGIEQKSMNPI
eukprot:scaffold107001_cov29-Tisochrysis_lutea.AAC.2